MKEAKTKSKNELLPGTLEMLILKTLSIESMHGYGIATSLAASCHPRVLRRKVAAADGQVICFG
jgi:DNA-binding PadR family transcriptional regulator